MFRSFKTEIDEQFVQLKSPFYKFYISNYGKLISLRGKQPRLIKYQKSSQDGGLSVTVGVSGNYVKLYPHRLVADIFVPNPSDFTYVGFKDGDKSNLCYKNLIWLDHQSTHNCKSSKSNKQIVCVETRQVYRSGYELAKKLGVSPTLVYSKVNTGQLLKGHNYEYYPYNIQRKYKLVEMDNGKVRCIYGGANTKYTNTINIVRSTDIYNAGYEFDDLDYAEFIRNRLNEFGYDWVIVGI